MWTAKTDPTGLVILLVLSYGGSFERVSVKLIFLMIIQIIRGKKFIDMDRSILLSGCDMHKLVTMYVFVSVHTKIM